MNATAGSSRPDAYAREIEREWSRILDRPIVLSPKDWVLISDWHARAIPLPLILESMRHAAERPGRRAAPRNLAYVAPGVEETWQVVLDGRRGSSALPTRRPAAVPDPIEAWRARREAEGGNSPLGRLLGDLLDAHENGEAAEAIDLRLDESLDTRVPEGLLDTTRDQVDADLAPFVERMDDVTFDRTRRAAIVDRLRRALNLPFLDRSCQGRQGQSC